MPVASCESLIPAVLTETAPLETSKSPEAKDEIPLLLVVASSPDIVTVPELSDTSIP